MNQSPRYQPNERADVCLLLEGTFPYVRGGVSTWVRQLIEGMPHLRFSIIYLGADSETHHDPVYELPANLIHLETHFLLDPQDVKQATPLVQRFTNKVTNLLRTVKRSEYDNSRFEKSDCCHAQLQQLQGKLDDSVGEGFAQLLCGDDAITETDLETHRAAWQSIRAQYARAPEGLDLITTSGVSEACMRRCSSYPQLHQTHR